MFLFSLLLAVTPAKDEATAFIRSKLTPCDLSTPIAAPETFYEPTLASIAKRVDELAPRSLPDFDDHELRTCGMSPPHVVSSVTAGKVAGDKLTIIADTGTKKLNNVRRFTFLIVQTSDGPRIWDARHTGMPSLRAQLEKRLKELQAVENERQAAVAFVRRLLEAPQAIEDVYAPSLKALGATDISVEPVTVASVSAGFHQSGRTLVHAVLQGGKKKSFIVETTASGPRLWDVLESDTAASLRVTLADKAVARDAQPLDPAEAVAWVRKQYEAFVAGKRYEERIVGGLAELMSVDGQLTEGVPYVNGDLLCACQDSHKASLESVKADGGEGGLIRVTVDFHVFPDPAHARHQTLVVVKTTKGFGIYDVLDAEGSLRARLSDDVVRLCAVQ